MISPFLAPRSLPSFLSECTGLVATTALPGNSPSHIQSPWSVPQIFFIAQLALSPPAFDVYRRLGAAVLQPKFSLEAFLSLGAVLSSCRRLLSTSTVRQASFGYRCSSGTVLFIYLTIFFIYSVSPVCPFLPLLFASGLRSERRLFYPLSHFSCCFPLFRSPVHALRYKRYTFFRPGFEGFLPSPPRLAAILFESPTRLQPSRFQRPHFPLLRVYKYAACIFCNTWFQIPCWQIVHVHINIIMAGLSYSSPPFNTKIHCKRENFFSWTWFRPNVFIAKFPLEALEKFPYNPIN